MTNEPDHAMLAKWDADIGHAAENGHVFGHVRWDDTTRTYYNRCFICGRAIHFTDDGPIGLALTEQCDDQPHA